jgi:crotonobetainyl-CoA hydratase
MREPQSASVLLKQSGTVAVVTLNRPEVLNAIDAKLANELTSALATCAANDDIRVIVLNGEGRAFCAGHNLAALAAGESVSESHHRDFGYAGIARHKIDKPIIVAAQGFMLGGGLEIALSADVIVAADNLMLGLPEVKMGQFAAAGGVVRISQQLPSRVAAWLIMSGQMMTAEEALRWGLVNEVVPESRLLERAMEMAETIASNAPLAVQSSKRMIRDLVSQSSWDDFTWNILTRELEEISKTADAAEGARALG